MQHAIAEAERERGADAQLRHCLLPVGMRRGQVHPGLDEVRLLGRPVLGDRRKTQVPRPHRRRCCTRSSRYSSSRRSLSLLEDRVELRRDQRRDPRVALLEGGEVVDTQAAEGLGPDNTGLITAGKPTCAAAADGARSKLRTLEASRDAGLPTPRFMHLPDVASLEAAAADVGFPAVIKPVFGAEALGCLRVDDLAALEEGYARVSALITPELNAIFQQGEDLLLEEYLDGPEFDVDMVLSEGAASSRRSPRTGRPRSRTSSRRGCTRPRRIRPTGRRRWPTSASAPPSRSASATACSTPRRRTRATARASSRSTLAWQAGSSRTSTGSSRGSPSSSSRCCSRSGFPQCPPRSRRPRPARR